MSDQYIEAPLYIVGALLLVLAVLGGVVWLIIHLANGGHGMAAGILIGLLGVALSGLVGFVLMIRSGSMLG